MTLFANLTRSHRGPGRQAIAARKAERRRFVDLFAECLAEGGEVEVCARRLGKSPSWGRSTLAEIRRGLGEQAA